METARYARHGHRLSNQAGWRQTLRMRSTGYVCLSILLAAAAHGAKRTPQTPTAQAPAVSVSFLRPTAGGCAWWRYAASTGTETKLATIPRTCAGVRIAWSPDGRRAL